ncbi:MAG: hypothetical protein HRF40_05770 [Nitrososphaera sp.]|jgi:hypothetical protein
MADKSSREKLAYAFAALSLGLLLFASAIAAGLNTGVADAQATTSSKDTQTPPKSIDELFSRIQDRLPGFAGYFYNDEGQLSVYLTQPSGTTDAQVSAVLANFVNAKDLEKGVVILQAKRDWKQWLGWSEILHQLIDIKGSGVNYLDIDEKNQVIVIGVSALDDATKANIDSFVMAHGIPAEDVRIVQTTPIKYASDGVPLNPLKGGAQIALTTGNPAPYCTTGFVANRVSDGMRVLVTAGHCENGIDMTGDQVYYQPVGGSRKGQEVANTNLPSPRFSDTLLWRPDAGVSSTLGKIWVGGLTLEYTITGKKSFPAVGEFVCKFGAKDHERCGTITATGLTFVGEDGRIFYQQARVSAAAQQGDSGGPIYKKGTGSSVTLYGTLVATDGVSFIFSPMSGIEGDQGTLQVN